MRWKVLLPVPLLAVWLSAVSPPVPATAPAAVPALAVPVEEWSKPVNGVEARIVISLHGPTTPGVASPYLWTYVEFQSILAKSVSISTHPILKWTLKDATGAVIPAGRGMRGGGGSGGEYDEQWVELVPGGGRYDVRVRTPGDFFGARGTRILALQTQKWGFGLGDAAAWALVPGEYALTGTVTCDKKPGAAADRWSGKLELPAVHFAVTAP